MRVAASPWGTGMALQHATVDTLHGIRHMQSAPGAGVVLASTISSRGVPFGLSQVPVRRYDAAPEKPSSKMKTSACGPVPSVLAVCACPSMSVLVRLISPHEYVPCAVRYHTSHRT